MSNGMQMTTKIVGFEDVGTVRCAVAETTAGWQTSREYVAVDAQGVKSYMGQTQGQEFRYDPPVRADQAALPRGRHVEGDGQPVRHDHDDELPVRRPASGSRRRPARSTASRSRSSMSLPGQPPHGFDHLVRRRDRGGASGHADGRPGDHRHAGLDQRQTGSGHRSRRSPEPLRRRRPPPRSAAPSAGRRWRPTRSSAPSAGPRSSRRRRRPRRTARSAARSSRPERSSARRAARRSTPRL